MSHSHSLDVGDLAWYRFSVPSQICIVTAIDCDDDWCRYTVLLESGEERKPHVDWLVPVEAKKQV